MYILGINFSHHSSVALLKDNELVLFIHEERLNRQKHWGGPKFGIPEKGLSLIKGYTKTLDVVCGSSGRHIEFMKSIDFLKSQGISINSYTLRNGHHHLHHAAAGFYMSHLDEATALVIDGAGSISKFKEDKGLVKASETTSIYSAKFPNDFSCLYKYFTVGIYDTKKTYIDNRKVPIDITQEEIDSFINARRGQDGRSQAPQPSLITDEPFTFKNTIQKIDVSTYLDIGVRYTLVSQDMGFRAAEGKTMGLAGYGNKQHSTENENKAYEIQKELEEVFLQRAAMCVEMNNSNNLVISGGCALNILGNSVIKKQYPNLNVYIDPIAMDGTNAIGIAAHVFYSQTGCTDKLKHDIYTGPNYQLNKENVYECARKYSLQ